MTDSTIRRLAWLVVLGQALFIASWIVAGALDPGYSALQQSVSELGGTFAEHAWIAKAGFVVFGISIAALAPALLHVLPSGRARVVAAVLFGLCGLAMASIAFLPIDCSFGTNDRCDELLSSGALSWQTEAHVWISLGLRLALVATPFALAAALRPRPISGAAIGAGIFGLAFGLATFGWSGAGDDPYGLIDRIELLVLQTWLVIVALAVIHSAQDRSRPSAPVPLAPRDFFGSAWSGEGEIVLRPLFLWRRRPVRVQVTRTPTPLSDESWVFEDRLEVEDRWTQTSRAFCRLTAPDRVEVIARQLPEGARVALDEGGYRIWPFQVLVPLGPIALVLDSSESSRVEPDGTLVQEFEQRLFGLLLSRATFRVRPVDTPAGAPDPLGQLAGA